MPVGGAYLFLKFICIIACYIFCGYGGIGRHKRLKISRRQLRAGSSPATRTVFIDRDSLLSLRLEGVPFHFLQAEFL